MDRRQFLRLSGVGSLAAIGGCPRGAWSESRPGGDGTPAETDAERVETRPPQLGDQPTVCDEDIRYDPGIYPVVEPAFGDDWSGAPVDESYVRDGGPGLPDRATVVGIEHGGVARAYPVAVLARHEIVNDRIGGSSKNSLPLVVTYCPLCRSGLVARRVVGGTTTRFFVSGLLWEPPEVDGTAGKSDGVFGANRTGGRDVSVSRSGNLVMYDEETKSYWSQLLARAICGPERGTDLSIVPSTVATWRTWRSAHPGGTVLLPPPASETTRS